MFPSHDPILKKKTKLREKEGIKVKSNGKCYYCALTLRKAFTSIDHVIPKSRGGTDEETNLVLSCRNCNLEKADRTDDEYKLQLAIYRNGGPDFTGEQLEWLKSKLKYKLKDFPF